MLRETARKSYPENVDNPMIVHHGTMKFVNLGESWIFTTKISGSDPQIYPGTFLFIVTIRDLPFQIIVESQLRSWKRGAKPDLTHRDTT